METEVKHPVLEVADAADLQQLRDEFMRDSTVQALQRAMAVQVPLWTMAGAAAGAVVQHWRSQGSRRGAGFLLGALLGLQVGWWRLTTQYRALDPHGALIQRAQRIVDLERQSSRRPSAPPSASAPSASPSSHSTRGDKELLSDEDIKRMMMNEEGTKL